MFHLCLLIGFYIVPCLENCWLCLSIILIMNRVNNCYSAYQNHTAPVYSDTDMTANCLRLLNYITFMSPVNDDACCELGLWQEFDLIVVNPNPFVTRRSVDTALTLYVTTIKCTQPILDRVQKYKSARVQVVWIQRLTQIFHCHYWAATNANSWRITAMFSI